jgi:hypothetical protein
MTNESVPFSMCFAVRMDPQNADPDASFYDECKQVSCLLVNGTSVDVLDTYQDNPPPRTLLTHVRRETTDNE